MEVTQRVKARLKLVNDWGSVIDETEAEISRLSDASEQSQGYAELGRVCETLLLDKARAMQCYQRAFKLDQANVEALTSARLIYRDMAHTEMVTRLMKLELRANSVPTRIAALNYDFGVASLLLRQVEAARPYLQQAVDSDPERQLYRTRLAEVDYDRASWQAAFEQTYAELGRASNVDDPLACDTSGRGPELAAIYMRAARMLHLESPTDRRILPLLFKVLDAEPTHEEAAYLVEVLLAQTGHLQHIQKLQDRRASLVTDPAEKAKLLEHFASVWAVRLNNNDMAAYFLRQVLELAYGDPNVPVLDGHAAAFRAVKTTALAQGNADSLISLAQRGLEKLSGQDNAILALEAGDLASQMHADPSIVQSFFDRADSPTHPYVLEWQRSRPQASEHATTHATPSAAQPAAAASAPISNEVSESSVASANEVETAAPAKKSKKSKAAPEEAAVATSETSAADLEAMTGEHYTDEERELIEGAMAAAERGDRRIIEIWREVCTKAPNRRFPRQKLKELYEQSSKWSNVADLLKEQLKLASDESAQEEILWELVELYRERLQQPSLVVQNLSALEKLAENSGDQVKLLAVLDAQQQQYKKMRRWAEAIGRIKRLAEVSQDSAQRISLHLEAGGLFIEKFSNQSEAIKSYESVLEDDPVNSEALGHLKDLYERRRDWEKLISLQQRELSLIDDQEERKARLLDIARTAAAKVRNPALSLQVWAAVIECDPVNVEALKHLEEFYERDKSWEQLAATLQTLSEVSEDQAQRIGVLTKLGAVYAEKLERVQESVSTWEELLKIDPNNRRAQDSLKKLYLDAGDMPALEAFYARQDKWADFVRVLEREVEVKEGGQRTSLFIKIAELYRTRLERPDRAIRSLERALSFDEHNADLAEALIELYEASGDERRLLVPLKIKLEATQDPDAHIGIMLRMANLCENVTKDYSQAFAYVREALAADVHRGELVEHAVRLAEQTSEWSNLVASMNEAAEKLGATQESVPMRLAAAQAYERELEAPQDALKCHETVLEIDPAQSDAVAALERLYLALGREEDLLNVLDRKLSLAADDNERRQTLLRIGGLRARVGQKDEAVAAYRSALDLDPHNAESLAALDKLFTSLERWSDLAEILERQLELPTLTESGRAEFLHRLGALVQEQLAQPERAVDLLREVLAIDPANEDARSRLESFLDDAQVRQRVATILLPVYEASHDAASVVRCLEIAVENEPDAQRRQQTLMRIGQLHASSLGDGAAALQAFSRAFREDPANVSAREAVEHTATAEGRWDELSALYESVVPGLADPALAQRLLERIASVNERELEKPERAIDAYRRALALDPENRDTLDALENLYQRTQAWPELLDIYRRKVAGESNPIAREAQRLRIAALQEELPGRTEEAIETYNEVLADSPDNQQALKALDRLYQGSGRWAALAEILERHLILATDEATTVNVALRLGRLRQDKLNQPGAAGELYARALDLEPTNAAAQSALEELLEVPEQQLMVARLLEPLYRRQSQWPSLIRVYEIMVSQSLDPAERVALLHRVAEIYEVAVDSPEKAFDALGRALLEDPSQAETQVRLDKLAQQLGAYKELVERYRSAAQDLVDERLRTQLLFKVAQIYDQTLNDPESAAAVYEQVLEINPNDIDAIDALISVRHSMNAFAQLVDAVTRKAEMVDNDEERKTLLHYAAQVYEKNMGQPERAVELYQQVLAIDDRDETALAELENIHIALENWAALKDIYARQLEIVEDPEKRKQILKVSGQVYDRELGDTDRAIDTYQALLEFDPTDIDAINALDRLYQQANRPLEQLQILERSFANVRNPHESAELRFRIGRLWQTELRDVAQAVDAYRLVLAQDLSHAPSLEALWQIANGDTEAMRAALVLEPVLANAGEWRRLIELYDVMARLADEPAAQIAHLHAAARVQTQQMQNVTAAFAIYERALEIDPLDRNTLQELENLAESANDWRTYAELLARQGTKTLDPNAKVALLERVARVELERGDVEQAIARYTQVLDGDPENRQAILALEDIFSRLCRWPDLVDNLRRQIRLAENEEAVISLQFRMAEIYRTQMRQVSEAIDAYREIVAIEPGHQASVEALEAIFESGEKQLEIAEILEPIYQADERWRDVVRLGRVRLAAIADSNERRAIVQSVANVCERKLDAPAEAFYWWLHAYADDPRNEEVAAEVERLAEITGQWSAVVDAGYEILGSAQAQAPDVQLVVLSQIGRILVDKLGDFPRAIEANRAVLAIDPANPEALRALDRIYTQAQEWGELSDILQRRLSAELDEATLIEIELRLANVLETHLGRSEQAVAAFNRVLDRNPGNAQALEALENLYYNRQSWEELFSIYQQLVQVAATDEETADCYQRMALLAGEALGRPAEAIDYWQRVLELRGEDGEALSQLAALYEGQSRWHDVVDVLERLIFVVDTPELKVEAYHGLGRIYGEKLNNERAALEAWNQARQLDPTDLVALGTLQTIFERNEQWTELVEVLEQMVAQGEARLGTEAFRATLARLGRVQGEALLNSDDAAQTWRRVLEIDPGDIEALEALERLYEQQGNWRAVADVLAAKCAVLAEPEARIAVLLRAADLWESHLGEQSRAVHHYNEVLEIDPSQALAADALERIYQGQGAWEDLARLCRRRAEASQSVGERVHYLRYAAKICEEKLFEMDEAFATLQHALNADYSNEDTARELERLATTAGKWEGLLAEYEERLTTLTDTQEICGLLVKMARWNRIHLERPDLAADQLERALHLDPENLPALRETAILEREAGFYDSLAQTLNAMVPLEPDIDQQVLTLMDLAHLEEGELNNSIAAIESYQRVLAIDGENAQALESLARLYEGALAWGELVEVLARSAAISHDSHEVIALKQKIGRIQEQRLERPADAIWTYREILDAEPTDREALAALERLYLADDKIDDYLGVLEAQLDSTVNVEEQIEAYEKMAKALLERAHDPLRAAEVLEKIIVLDSRRDDIFTLLEQLYGELRRWPEMIESYRAHVEACDDPARSVELLTAMAGVLETQIEDPERAAETYRQILDIDPTHAASADKLSRLQELIEDWEGAVETMGRLAALTDDPTARVELLTRMGRVYSTQLHDLHAAEVRLNEALAIDPAYVPALTQLAEIYRGRRDWLNAARTLQLAAECSSNRLERTTMAAEAGYVYLEELNDRARATELFELVMSLDPEHLRVGQLLARLYYDAQDYDKANGIFEMLTRKADQLDASAEQLCELFNRAGTVARARGDEARALQYFQRAYEIDATDRDVLAGMADLLFQQEQWDQAFKLYQTMLVQHRDSQSDDDTVLVYYRLGTIKRHQREMRKALNYLEKALEIDPSHRPTLDVLVEMQSEAGDWESVIAAKRSLASMADVEQQAHLYREIGDLYSSKLGNRRKAAEAYESALELRRDDFSILHTLLDLHTTGEQWADAVAVIDRIVAIETDAQRRSRYNYTAAVLLRDQLHARDEAVARFNQVLDDDPTFLKAFQATDSILTKAKDWKQLERNYRKMIKRLAVDGDPALVVTLWDNLGEIYRTRLNSYESAAEAYAFAAKLEPQGVQRHVILAELYQRLVPSKPEEYIEKAVAEHQQLLFFQPQRYESYHALYEIYRDSRQLDKAHCVAGALSMLKQASPEEASFFQKNRPSGLVRARQRLGEDTLRRHVMHPQQDRYFTAIMGVTARALAAARAQTPTAALDASQVIDAASNQSRIAKVVKYIRDLLNVQMPDLIVRPNDAGDAQLLNLKRGDSVRPTIVVMQNLISGKSEEELAFAFGRLLGELYLPHYSYVAVDRSSRKVKEVFMAALAIAGLLKGADPAAEAEAKRLRAFLSGAEVDQLRELVKRFEQSGGSTDVKQWAGAVELTCYRLGLIMSGDLQVAASMVSREELQVGSMFSPQEKLKELLLYSVSEDYFAVRKALGVQVA
jgi:tetratricopeptide (TPR) repeat protein